MLSIKQEIPLEIPFSHTPTGTSHGKIIYSLYALRQGSTQFTELPDTRDRRFSAGWLSMELQTPNDVDYTRDSSNVVSQCVRSEFNHHIVMVDTLNADQGVLIELLKGGTRAIDKCIFSKRVPGFNNLHPGAIISFTRTKDFNAVNVLRLLHIP